MNQPDDQDKRPVVGIVMGSDSDWGVMQEAASVLKQLDIDYDVTVSSAHRTPKRTADYARSARNNGRKVIIAGAGTIDESCLPALLEAHESAVSVVSAVSAVGFAFSSCVLSEG